jgi:hypothetical protein
MGLVYNNKRIKTEIGDKSQLDIISLNKMFIKRGDNLLSSLLYKHLYLLPDKETFQNNWDVYIKKYDEYLNERDNKNIIIPKEYYTKEIIEDILYYVGYFSNNRFDLINQYVDGFADVIKEYISSGNHGSYNQNYVLQYIKHDIKGYYDLFKFFIKSEPYAIRFVSNLLENDKLVELCKLAVSINGFVLQFVDDKIILSLNPEVCYIAVRQNGEALRHVPKSIKNYYSFVKAVYEQNKEVIMMQGFPKEYLDDLKRDFPEDREYLQKYLLKEYVSREIRKLLREAIYKKENF